MPAVFPFRNVLWKVNYTVKIAFTYELGFYLNRIIKSFSCSVRSGSWTGGDGVWVELSGKMHVLARLLALLRNSTDDRIVLVSNYTQV